MYSTLAMLTLSVMFAAPAASDENPASGPESDSAAVVPDMSYRDLDEKYNAVQLLRKNRIGPPAGRVIDVERPFGTRSTLVWVAIEHSGMPIFREKMSYVFDAAGKVLRDSSTREPLLQDGRLPDPNWFPADHRPDVSATDAVRTWQAAVSADESLARDFKPSGKPVATLGFYDPNRRTGPAPDYRLAWEVRPARASYPLAIVDAKQGGVLFFESGIPPAYPSSKSQETARDDDTSGKGGGEVPGGDDQTPEIITVFACSDYCPGPEELYLKRVFRGVVDEDECIALGGRPMSYYGWGETKLCLAE